MIRGEKRRRLKGPVPVSQQHRNAAAAAREKRSDDQVEISIVVYVADGKSKWPRENRNLLSGLERPVAIAQVGRHCIASAVRGHYVQHSIFIEVRSYHSP